MGMCHRGFTLWLTGLPGSGKSTVSKLVVDELLKRGLTRVELLDGDIIRQGTCKGLGYTREDRDENIRRIALVSELLTRNGVATVVAAISPYCDARKAARQRIGADNFIEVYCKATVEACTKRDPKGHYKKAINGEIEHFTGVSNPYEEPLRPELVLDTESQTPEQSAGRVIEYLEEHDYLALEATSTTLS